MISYSGKKVAIVGLGKSNQSLARYLAKEGACITCFDAKAPHQLGAVYHELSLIGVAWSLGPGYLDSLPEYRWVFLTPGIDKRIPEIRKAKEQGAVISNESGLFLERCKGKLSGVTGSAGKTTTCTLAGAMLRNSMPSTLVYVGGNIGTVLIEEVDSIAGTSPVVLEMSSFQLETATKSPEVSAVLNVRPNHLDMHDSFEDYLNAKKRIFEFQGSQDWCVLNLDDAESSFMGPECPGKVAYFTLYPERAAPFLEKGNAVAWLSKGELLMGGFFPGGRKSGRGGPIRVARASDLPVPGRHNVSNALAAIMLASLLGATPEGMRSAILGFRGVPHRIEFVAEKHGVKYYNDSIATSPDRTAALLEALAGPLVVILGGYDKGIPFDGLAEQLVGRGCRVVTMGDTAPKIEEALEQAFENALDKALKGAPETTPGKTADWAQGVEVPHRGGVPRTKPLIGRAKSLEDAVAIASSAAERDGSVALSPACASYGMFTDFTERGRRFREIVGRIE